ncbi:MAG: carbohydrate-binding protein, partial [Pseudomonadota bacterium]
MAFDTPLLLQGEDLEILPDGTPATDDDSVARTRTENQERAGLNNPGGVPVTPEEAAAGAFDAYGLRPNYAGDGYLDMNGPLGAKLAFTFDAAPGTYDIVVRVANGDPDAARSIALSTDGGLTPAQPTQTTEWFLWETRTFTVTFGGADPDLAVPRRVEIVTDGDNGPNIDAVAIVESGQTVSFFPPVIETTALSAAENALAVGSVLASDGDGQGVTFAITGGADADKFTITEAGDLSFLTAPDFEAPGSAGGSNTYEVEVTATDGMESVAQTVSVVVTDVAETSGMVFDTATITGYSNQDRPDSGPGVTVAPDGRSVTLDGNLWKRAPVDPFTIDDLTVLRVTIEELSPSEIVAIGFDVDGDPFDADGSIYQLAGTQATPNAFTDLRGTSVSADGRTTFEIDLSAHAGATVSSLVLIADDDKAGDGLGAVTFSAVEVAQVEPGNSDPRVVGGGTADFEVPQGGAVEIDLPFVDDDGDPLTYTFDVTLDGAPVDDFPLTETGGTLSGDLGTTPQGAYTIVTTATDGQGGVVATDSFVLEVVAPNQSPVADDDLALEPLSGAVGQAIAPIELADYAFAFTDPEGQTLTLSAEGLPAGLTVDADGRITGTPIAVGDGTFTLVATDPFGASASIEVPLLIDAPSVGDVTVVEAEDFTGLAGDTAFFATGQAGASNDQLIRTVGNKAATVTTDLSANGVAEGWYRVAIDIYDETDGTAEYSLSVGDVQLSAPGATFDDDGTFTNPGINRGNAGQLGNRKRLDFDTPVYVEGGTILTLSGQADGELLRTDRVFFTRIEAPGAAPTDLALAADPVTEGVAGAVVGQLSAVDPDGDDAAIAFSVDAGSPFEVVGTELRLKAGEALDFESAASVDVAVTATDAGGQSTVATVTVAVADANDAPELGAGASLDDIAATVGTESRTDLSVLAATDQDAGDTVTYGVRSGSAVPLPTGIAVVDGELVVADDVPAGSYTIEVFATDGTAESDAVTLTVTVTEAGAFAPLVLQAEDFALVADGDGDPTNDNLIRTATQNPERDDDPATPAPSNPGLPGFNGLGLRPGYTGEGYLDVEGADTGAQATASFTAPAGTYDITLRLANGSDDANPITVSVDGQDLQVTDTRTGEWFQWETRTVTVTLATDGTHTIALNQDTATGAPHIDALAVTETGVAATFPLDTDADVDGNFALDGDTGELSPTQAASINLNVTGLDADIVRIELSFDGGATRTDVTALPDADGDFVFDGSALVAGPQTATVIVTDAAGNEATDDLSFTIAEGDPSGFDPVTIQAEDTGQVAILDDTGNGLNDPRTTQIADDTNPGPFGTLHSGAVGNAYADMGTDPGDALAITLTVPSDGTYTATIRYANGASTDRPMEIAVGGTVVETIDFAPTTGGSPTNWSAWTDVTVDLTLTAGENTITLAIPEGGNNGPNIDQFTFEAKEVGPPVAGPDRFVDVIKVNFEAPTSGNGAFDAPAGYVTPDGFEADTGAAFGDRGNGFTYGWVDVDDATGTVTATPLAQPIGSMRYKATVSEASDLQKTFAHLDYPGVADGDRERAWEIALANGTYELTVAVGDTAGPHDSTYLLNVEGMQFGPAWDPVNLAGETVVAGYSPALDGEGFRSNLHTGIVQVADGRLTIDGIDGTNVELQWLDLQRVPDLTPDDGRTADLDYSKFIDAVAASTLAGQVTIEIGPDGTVPLDIDPTSDIVLGVQLQAIDHRGPAVQFTEGVKLVETLTGVEVPVYVQVTGGADSLTIRPLTDLKEFTSYTLKVEDVLDLG